MPADKITQDVLNDFVSTVDAKPDLSEQELLQKFPEFGNDAKVLQAAADYRETVKSGKYKTIEDINSKFPEFTALKKKDDTQSGGNPQNVSGAGKSTSKSQEKIDTPPVWEGTVLKNNKHQLLANFDVDPKTKKTTQKVRPEDKLPPVKDSDNFNNVDWDIKKLSDEDLDTELEKLQREIKTGYKDRPDDSQYGGLGDAFSFLLSDDDKKKLQEPLNAEDKKTWEQRLTSIQTEKKLREENDPNAFDNVAKAYMDKSQQVGIGNTAAEKAIDYGKVTGLTDYQIATLDPDANKMYGVQKQIDDVNSDIKKYDDLKSRGDYDEEVYGTLMKQAKKKLVELHQSMIGASKDFNKYIDDQILDLQKQKATGVKQVASVSSGIPAAGMAGDFSSGMNVKYNNVPLTDDEKRQLDDKISILQKQKENVLSVDAPTKVLKSTGLKESENKGLIPTDASDLQKVKIYANILTQQVKQKGDELGYNMDDVMSMMGSHSLAHNLGVVATGGSPLGFNPTAFQNSGIDLLRGIKSFVVGSSKKEKDFYQALGELKNVSTIALLNRGNLSQKEGVLSVAAKSFNKNINPTNAADNMTQEDKVLAIEKSLNTAGVDKVNINPSYIKQMDDVIKDAGTIKHGVAVSVGDVGAFGAKMMAFESAFGAVGSMIEGFSGVPIFKTISKFSSMSNTERVKELADLAEAIKTGVSTGTKTAAQIEKMQKQLTEAKQVYDYVQKFSKVDNVFTRLLVGATSAGVTHEVIGRVNTELSGFANAQVGASNHIIGASLSKLGSMALTIFGNNAPKYLELTKDLVSSTGSMVLSMGTMTVGQDIENSTAGKNWISGTIELMHNTESLKKFNELIDEQFGTSDKRLKFVAEQGILGAILHMSSMGTLSKWVGDGYKKQLKDFSPEEQKKVEDFIAEQMTEMKAVSKNIIEEEKVKTPEEKPNEITPATDVNIAQESFDTPLDDIGDGEYKEFKANGVVAPERIDDIAKKIKEGTQLTDREKEILDAKHKEIDAATQIEKNDIPPAADIVAKTEEKTGDVTVPNIDNQNPEQKEEKIQANKESKKWVEKMQTTSFDDIHTRVLQYFATGGKVNTADLHETGFVGKDGKVKDKTEWNRLFPMQSKSAPTIEKIVERIVGYGADAKDYEQAREAVIEILSNESKASSQSKVMDALMENELADGVQLSEKDMAEKEQWQREQLQNEEDNAAIIKQSGDQFHELVNSIDNLDLSDKEVEQLNDFLRTFKDENGSVDWEKVDEHLKDEDAFISISHELEDKINKIIKDVNARKTNEQPENADTGREKAPEETVSEDVSAGRQKAAKEYDAERERLEREVTKAKKEKQSKLDSLNKSVDLFADSPKENELLSTEQDLSKENIDKTMKPYNEAIVKAEKLLSDHEANKEKLLKKYDDQTEIDSTPKNQVEQVKQVLADGAKSIKEVAEQTKILEPNIRRILGQGAKNGIFERVDKGVYVLTTKDGKRNAYIETGDAVESLERMANEGQKFDSIFLDPAYFSRALIGGNRGIKQYDFIHPKDFAQLMKHVSKLVDNDATHVYVMLSGARSAQEDMLKYVNGVSDAGFKLVGEGGYQKTFKDGKPVTNVRGEVAQPERLMLFTLSGDAREGEIPVNLNFRFVRPSIKDSYQTEKPKELLEAIIRQSTLEGETILDPFAGSGVTGEQALKADRNVVLVEKQPDVVKNVIMPRLLKDAVENKPVEEKPMEEKTPAPKLTGKDLAADAMDRIASKWGAKKNLTEDERTSLRQDLIDLGVGLIQMGKATLDDVIDKIYAKIKSLDVDIDDKDFNDLTKEVRTGIMERSEELGDKAEPEITYTSIKNATVDKEMESRGMKPIMKTASKEFGQTWDEAMQKINSEPEYQDDLIESLAQRPRPVTDVENAVLLHKQIDLQNQYDKTNQEIIDASESGESITGASLKLARISDDLLKLYNINREVGTENARGLNSRKMLASNDYTLANMEVQKRAANNGAALTEKQKAEIADLHAKIQDTQKAYDEYVKKKEIEIADLKAQHELDKLKKTVSREKRAVTHDQLKAERKKIVSNIKDKLALIAERIASKTGAKKNIIEDEGDTKEILKELAPDIAKLAKNLVEDGVNTLSDIVDNIHAELSGLFENITKRDIRDTLSGYGKETTEKIKTEAQKTLEEIKKQGKLLSRLEDLVDGMSIPKTNKQRAADSEEVADLKKQINDFLDEQEAKNNPPVTKKVLTPDEIKALKLAQLKTRLQKNTDAVKQKIKEVEAGTYEPKKKSVPLYDAEALTLKAANEKAKGDFKAALEKDRLANALFSERTQDLFVKWQRAWKLSGLTVLAKLTSAGTLRMAFTPLEEVVGAGASAAFPSLAKKAYREGYLNLDAESKAIAAAWTKGIMSDMKAVLTTGKSELDLVYGKKGHLPPEALDFFGQIHSALKTAPKRNEFERSVAKRISAMTRAGINIDDPVTNLKIMTDAYKDANRSIFMQDNAVSTGYQMMIHYFESKDKNGETRAKALATAMKWMMPFVKVPTNIVGEAFTNATGLERGAYQLAKAYINGIENLSPEKADVIMRLLKKGLLGTTMLALGAWQSDKIGGYFHKGQKKEPNDVDYGGLRVFGVDLPKFLLHNPLLEMLQLGATIRQVAEHYSKNSGENEGVSEGVISGVLGLTEELPMVKTPLELTRALDPNERRDYFNSILQNTLDPALATDVAKMIDRDPLTLGTMVAESPVKREPAKYTNGLQRSWQWIEMGLPVLRQNVPKKVEKGSNSNGFSVGGGFK